MNPFSLEPPAWTQPAQHATQFCCPRCHEPAAAATEVWLNRRSPVYLETTERSFLRPPQRKWQEFYLCTCGFAWWAWSNDRPPTTLQPLEAPPEDGEHGDDWR